MLLIAAFAVLGAYVSGRPPGALDRLAFGLKGVATPAALAFTDLGLWYVLVPAGALVLAVAIRTRTRVAVVAVWALSQVVSQALVAALKPSFHRLRPPGSIGYHPSDFSYPSGHAVTAVVFYGVLAYLVLTSALPRPVRTALALLLLLCVAGIPWSRLALGAHFATDVLGGLLFGCGWTCLLLTLTPALPRRAAGAGVENPGGE